MTRQEAIDLIDRFLKNAHDCGRLQMQRSGLSAVHLCNLLASLREFPEEMGLIPCKVCGAEMKKQVRVASDDDYMVLTGYDIDYTRACIVCMKCKSKGPEISTIGKTPEVWKTDVRKAWNSLPHPKEQDKPNGDCPRCGGSGEVYPHGSCRAGDCGISTPCPACKGER